MDTPSSECRWHVQYVPWKTHRYVGCVPCASSFVWILKVELPRFAAATAAAATSPLSPVFTTIPTAALGPSNIIVCVDCGQDVNEEPYTLNTAGPKPPGIVLSPARLLGHEQGTQDRCCPPSLTTPYILSPHDEGHNPAKCLVALKASHPHMSATKHIPLHPTPAKASHSNTALTKPTPISNSRANPPSCHSEPSKHCGNDTPERDGLLQIAF